VQQKSWVCLTQFTYTTYISLYNEEQKTTSLVQINHRCIMALCYSCQQWQLHCQCYEKTM